MMRGMVFDKKIGFVGFYHRIGDQTLGFDQQGIVIKTDDLIGTFFLEKFLKIFSCITPFDSVSKALSQFGKQ